MVTGKDSKNNTLEYIKLLQRLRQEVHPTNTKQIAQEIIQLVHGGVNPNLSLKEADGIYNNETALMLFAKAGLLDEMKELINQKAKLDIVDKVGQNLLHYAAQAPDTKALDYLNNEHNNFFIKNLNKEASNYKGLNITPLHNAALDGTLDNVKYLIQSGADPLSVNNEGHSLADIIYIKQQGNDKLQQIFSFLAQYDLAFTLLHSNTNQPDKNNQDMNSIKHEILELGKKIRADRKARFKQLLSGNISEAMDGSKRNNLLNTQLRNKKALNTATQI